MSQFTKEIEDASTVIITALKDCKSDIAVMACANTAIMIMQASSKQARAECIDVLVRCLTQIRDACLKGEG